MTDIADKGLIVEINEQIEWCEELVQIYKNLGPAGIFGATMIQGTIDGARKVIEEGNETLIRHYLELLQSCE